MAYQNVGTPRFYVNDLLWGASLGVTTLNELIDGNPAVAKTVSVSASGNTTVTIFDRLDYDKPNYYAILGHTISDLDNCAVTVYFLNSDGAWNEGHNQSPLVNGNSTTHSYGSGGYSVKERNGFSISKMTGSSKDDTYGGVQIKLGTDGASSGDVNIGQFLMGKYFDTAIL